MQDKSEVVDVVLDVFITKDPENPKRCKVVPDFRATVNSVVTFHVSGPPTLITFLRGDEPLSQTEISPFDENEFEVDKKIEMTVRSKARGGKYAFGASWPEAGGDVVGNGSGEVIRR
jgi:hypothetical protein